MIPEEILRNYQNRYLLSSPLYTDFAGGLNTRVSPPEMAINQSVAAENVIYNVASGAVSARDGTVRHVSEPVPFPTQQNPYGLFQAKYAAGSRFIVVGGYDPVGAGSNTYSIYYWDGSAWQTVSGFSYTNLPASRRVTGSFFNDAQIVFDGVNEPYALTLAGGVVTYNQLVAGGAPAHLIACEFSAVYNNRVYCASPSSAGVSFSDPLDSAAVAGTLPTFPAENQVFPGGPTDGDPVTGLVVAYGHLLIFKRNSIYALSDSNGSPSITQVASGVGMVIKHGFCRVESSVWFFGPSGLYAIGSDLTPEFQSDFVLPDYQLVLAGLRIDGGFFNTSTNHPILAYNQAKQQVWCACYSSKFDYDAGGSAIADWPHNVVYIHDVVNKDASGRPAVSYYKFYTNHDLRPYDHNYNPILLIEGLDSSNNPCLFSLIRSKVVAGGPGNATAYDYPCYLMRHDVSLADGSVGDDGNSVAWRWQSKFFNLGDPLRLKALRYYSIFGDIRDSAIPNYSKKFWRYDPYPTPASAVLATLPVNLKGATMAMSGDDFVVFGGILSDGTYSRSIYYYDASATIPAWTELDAQMPSGGHAYGCACVASDGNVYIFGGATTSSSQVSSIYTFVWADLLSGAATAPTVLSQTMLIPRAQHSIALDSSNQRVYIFGTSTVPAPSANIFEVFDIATLTSTALTSPTLRNNCAGSSMVFFTVSSVDYLHLFMGSLVQFYKPSTGAWTTEPLSSSVRSDLMFSPASYYTTYSSPSAPPYIVLHGGEAYSDSGGDGAVSDEVCLFVPSLGGTGSPTYILPSLPAPASRFASAFVGGVLLGNMYLAGGRPAAIRASFVGTNDFTTTTSESVDVDLNDRHVTPASVASLARFWSIIFEGRINDGLSRLTGFNLDYIMFQRRN